MTFNEANDLLKRCISDDDAQSAFGVMSWYHYCDDCTHREVCEMKKDCEKEGFTVGKCRYFKEK